MFVYALATLDPCCFFSAFCTYFRPLPGIKRDPFQAAIYFKKAAEGENADGQVNLAQMMFNQEGGQKRDIPEIFRLLHKAAGHGHIMAMYFLGEIHQHGIGTRSVVASSAGERQAGKWADLGSAWVVFFVRPLFRLGRFLSCAVGSAWVVFVVRPRFGRGRFFVTHPR